MLNGLDLFSGIGGISLALQPWVRTVCYVEIDRYCQRVIEHQINQGNLENAPIWDDITTFDPGPWIGKVDIITGGFPCQDISVAGRGAGLAGERSGLFWEIIRIANDIQPGFIFLENVPAILTRGGGIVVSALTELRYDLRWGLLSAFDMGAPHLRERWWLLASNAAGNTIFSKREIRKGETSNADRTSGKRGYSLAHTNKVSVQRERPSGQQIMVARHESRQPESGGDEEKQSWAIEPDVGRVANGIPARVDRLKGLGNSVVPACAREAFRRLMGFAGC